jgi:hypothetical protein
MANISGSRTRLITGRWVEPRESRLASSRVAGRLDKKWIKLRKSYCSKFDAEMSSESTRSHEWRAELQRITLDYVTWSVLEMDAPPRDVAVKALENLAYHAGEIVKAIGRLKDYPLALSIVRADIEALVTLRDVHSSLDDECGLTELERAEIASAPLNETPRPPPTVRLMSFIEHVNDYARAAHTAAQDMTDEATIAPGDAWDRWIARITDFCERNGLPTSVSKGSKFVEFVEALQELLVEEFKDEIREKRQRMIVLRTKRRFAWALRSGLHGLKQRRAIVRRLIERQPKNAVSLAKAIGRARKSVRVKISSQNAREEA